MSVRPIILSIASILFVSGAVATELPPELPFQTEAVESLIPNPEVNPQEMHPDDGMPVTSPDGAPPPMPPAEQPVPNDAPTEPAPVEQEKAKPKKRPKILDKAPEPTPAKTKNDELDLDMQSAITIRPKAGRTESVIIAKGKLNRVLTPYADPKVLTVDNIETTIDGSAIYIATSSDTPVSLFISDTETGDAASLQLSPQELIMPVEIRIEADPSKSIHSEAGSPVTDKLFRQGSPYTTEVKAIMQSLGRQQIPQGFTLEEMTEELINQKFCHDQNLTYSPGQLLGGHDSRIVILIGQNNGNSPVVFEEAFCAGEDTMAVAAWPKVRLEPGEKTEVYLLLRLPEGKNGEEIRPSLL